MDGVSAYTLDKGQKKWFFPVKGGVAGDISIFDGRVFFGGADGFIYALYLDTGRMLWKYYTGAGAVSAPAVRGQHLYLAGADKFYCLHKGNGENIWTYSVQARSAEFIVEGRGRPLVGNALVYFKVSDGSLIALDFKGRLKWKHNPSVRGRFASAVSTPVYGKICLYSANLESGLYCLSKKTGKVKWKTSPGAHGDLFLSGNRLFYSSPDGTVNALDQQSGKILWSIKVEDSIATAPVLYGDILIYGEYSGALRFVSAKTGRRLRSFYFGSGMSAPPVVSIRERAVYFMSNAGWLYKLSLKK